jgi:hypothetical protein
MTARYAVLMKVHYWDDFAERRLQHLVRKVGTGDVYVFVDETRGTVGQIAHDHVIRATERDMERLKVILHPCGDLFWYNNDYPLYYFYLENNSYDYFVMCEYDAVLNIDIDEFVRIAERDRVDYVGSPVADSFSSWSWRATCDGVYPQSFTLYNWLNCISLFSRRSIKFLLERRQILARRFKAGEIENWPFSEAFIATEMQNNGFVVRKLGDFGKVEKYAWWPPILENDLPSLQDQAFLHPVLDEQRYVTSCVRQSRVKSYFSRDSELRQLLNRVSPLSAIPALLKEFIRRKSKIWSKRSPLQRQFPNVHR